MKSLLEICTSQRLSLSEYIIFQEKLNNKIIIEFDKNFNETYEYDKDDITIHGNHRFNNGDLKSGGVNANIDEIKNIIYKCDSIIEEYMLNRKPKSSDCRCGIQLFNKDKSSIVIAGEIINFDFNKCTYRFKIFTGRKFLHYYKWYFKNDELIISNDNKQLKIEII